MTTTSLQKNSILLACLAVICTQAGMLMYVPSMSYLSSSFNTDYKNIVYTLTSYLFGYGIAMLIGGGFSDRFGRKNSYLITIAIFSLSSLLLIYTRSIYIFILLRLLQGIGGGGCAVIGRASVRDLCEGKILIRGMSFISMSFNVSMGIFQFLGGIAQSYLNYKYDFIFMFLFGTALFILVLIKFSDASKQENARVTTNVLLQNYISIIKDKRLITLAAAAGMGYSILLVFNIIGIVYLQSAMNVSASAIGMIGIYFSIAYLLGGLFLNFIISLYGLDKIIFVGMAFIILSAFLSAIFLMISANTFMFIILPSLLGVFGQAIFYPSLMSKAVEPYKYMAGSASSLFGFTQQITGFVISTVAGSMPTGSISSLTFMLVLIALGASLFQMV